MKGSDEDVPMAPIWK